MVEQLVKAICHVHLCEGSVEDCSLQTDAVASESPQSREQKDRPRPRQPRGSGGSALGNLALWGQEQLLQRQCASMQVRWVNVDPRHLTFTSAISVTAEGMLRSRWR